MKEDALISIIMGIHNGKGRCDAAIESICKQTYTNWVFIICDDGSTDGSYEYLNEKYGNDSKFIIIKNEKNIGLAATLDHCLEYANGEFVARMDDDDISYPDRFEKQIIFLNMNPEISFVSSSVDLFNGKKVVGQRILKSMPEKKDLIWNSPFVHPATMFRAADLKKIGGYRVAAETVRGQDYDLFMRMYGIGCRGANLTEPVYRFTVDENNLKRRTFKARIGEMKIRRYGYSAMGVMPLAAPMILKPLVAYVIMGLRNRLKKRGF